MLEQKLCRLITHPTCVHKNTCNTTRTK